MPKRTFSGAEEIKRIEALIADTNTTPLKYYFMVEPGANLDVNNYQQTPSNETLLTYACANGYTDAAKVLIKYTNINVIAVNSENKNALDIILDSARMSRSLCQMILEKMAEVNLAVSEQQLKIARNRVNKRHGGGVNSDGKEIWQLIEEHNNKINKPKAIPVTTTSIAQAMLEQPIVNDAESLAMAKLEEQLSRLKETRKKRAESAVTLVDTMQQTITSLSCYKKMRPAIEKSKQTLFASYAGLQLLTDNGTLQEMTEKYRTQFAADFSNTVVKFKSEVSEFKVSMQKLVELADEVTTKLFPPLLFSQPSQQALKYENYDVNEEDDLTSDLVLQYNNSNDSQGIRFDFSVRDGEEGGQLPPPSLFPI